MEDQHQRAVGVGSVVGFSALPGALVESVVSLTSPRDACRITCVSSALRSAADSDSVWGRFLPPDYQSLVERAVDSSSVSHASLKELYFRLCNGHVLIDGGSLSFWLDKRSGIKCYMLSATALSITWGNTPMYWDWISLPESRFPYAAKLITVCWLDIRGKMDARMLSPNTRYAAYLVFKLGTSSCGFENCPVEVAVGVVGREYAERSIYLARKWRGRRQRDQIGREDQREYLKKREDGWMEVGLGKVFSGSGEHQEEVEMRVMQTQHLHWKSGIIVQGMEIRPKED